jgi:hypothetical protein
MNHYYAEFHARDSIERLHREADGSRRAAQALDGRGAATTGRAIRSLRAAVFVVAALIVGVMVALPADAGKAFTDRIENVDSILAVAFPDDYPVGSIMRAECAFVQRVQLPDGSAFETLSCDLSDDPVMVPEFQGVAPTSALNYGGGSCEWTSEYWSAKTGATIFADSYRVVVTPAGKVHATSTYSADPLECG